MMANALYRPLGLLAELTYRCPLACAYCSNPIDLDAYRCELDTGEWCGVLDQAAGLGVLQVHLSGGEPLVRRDLTAIAEHARRQGLYVNLVTSGLGLTEAAMAAVASSGVDHVQLSVQDADWASSDRIAGAPSYQRKLRAAAAVRAAGLPLTVNVVLHRTNIGSVPALVELALRLGAQRLELANAQYYGWALRNRQTLLPTSAQLATAAADVHAARLATAERLEIVYVLADYHTGYPKPCMNGWGRRQLTVVPDGTVLPCPAAGAIPGLGAWNVRTHSLAEAWHDSPAFTSFRGFEWMREPCASCARRVEDFGGCRCQAYLLTGDPAATDPACRLSPNHHLVTDAVVAAGNPPPTPRVSRPHAARNGGEDTPKANVPADEAARPGRWSE